jgi:hypothetical protein
LKLLLAWERVPFASLIHFELMALKQMCQLRCTAHLTFATMSKFFFEIALLVVLGLMADVCLYGV